MFSSSNLRYIAKTTTKSDFESLLNILPQYVDYMAANKDSLLVRFLGAHCIRMYGNDLFFVVMNSVFPDVEMTDKYDLKGSWVNRHCKVKENFKGELR
jgi:hypothetical protein